MESRPAGFGLGDDHLEIPKTLFIGLGATVVGWYRCYMPAMHLNSDWIGVVGTPPKLRYVTGLVGSRTVLPNYLDYDVLVLQQPRGRGWLQLIKGLQARGKKVVYEVDDYLHAIHKMPDHDFAEGFGRAQLAEYELCMRACDAMIVSTPFLYTKYRRFNKRVYVCENGIDTARHALTRPPRPTVNVGWAGGTGHVRAAVPWLREIPDVMRARENACFITVGQNFADALKPEFGHRCISIPFTPIEVYPSAMTMFDIALAPAGKGLFFRGKSDLRWLEAGALGVPTIADPSVYCNIEHGVTGFHAHTPEEARELLVQLIDDEKLRVEVGANARDVVLEQRSMQVAARAWADVLTAL